jgi:dipeptidyl aminopeptidase/acylaminoacyl peptidase
MSPARTLVLSAAAFALLAPAARADVFAASSGRPAGRTDLDLVLVNASTNAPVALPAGVNTAGADELHPSVSADGSRLVFERRSGATVRIILTDLKTGQSADLFSGFEQAANPQVTPSISADGRTVVTGEAFVERPQVLLTDVSAFPAGPYPRSSYQASFAFGSGTTGATSNPVIKDNQLAFEEQPTGATKHIVVGELGGPSSQSFGSSHPALGAPGGIATLLFDFLSSAGTRDLAFTTFTSPQTAQTGTIVPLAQLNSSFHQHRPSFSPDGRYIAFDDYAPAGALTLNVWDSQTQTILNDGGPQISNVDNPLDGSTTIYVKPVLKTTTIQGPVVRFQLLQPSGIGILVQRVVGHHRQFGRTVPTLRMIGRVPLGRFRSGSGRVRWNGRVNGRKLRRGTYQVTVRAVDASAHVLDLGRPRQVRVA